jgi:LuxR family transcriptional activator of conjugal transfer of Ti plasmids
LLWKQKRMSQAVFKVEPPPLGRAVCAPPYNRTRLNLDVETAIAVPDNDLHTVQEDLLHLAQGAGFQGAVYAHLGHSIPTSNDGFGSAPIRFAASSTGTRLWYLGEDGEVLDPVSARVREGGLPFLWSTTPSPSQDFATEAFYKCLRRRGIFSGLCVPIADYVAGPAYVSFLSAYEIGADDPEIAEKIPGLAFAAQKFHVMAKTALSRTSNSDGQGRLTAREIACLRLGALGRTVAESASALNVTPRTIEFHLKNAAEKFGAPNKLRTILMAVNAGLIEV